MTLISWIDGDGRESQIDLPIVPREIKVDGRVVDVEQPELKPVVSYEEYPVEDRYCSNCKYEPVRITEQPCIDCGHVDRCLWQPANPKPIDTGLDAEGLPEDWTWFDGLNGKQFCVIGRNTSTMNDLPRCIIAYYPIDNAITYIGTRKGCWADLHFLGRSAPGCDLDGLPLVGSVWDTPILKNIAVDSVTDSLVRWKLRNADSFNCNSLDWWFGSKEERTFIRMSQLDPPKTEPKLSETVKVGTVFKWSAIDCAKTVDFVGDYDFTYHFSATDNEAHIACGRGVKSHLDGSAVILVSHPADKPLHERVRLGSKVRDKRINYTSEVTALMSTNNIVVLDAGISTRIEVKFDNFDRYFDLVEE